MIILLLIIFFLILLEYDRVQSFEWNPRLYYIDDCAMILVGCINNFIRCFSFNHPDMSLDCSKWFKDSSILKSNWEIMRDEAINITNNYELKNFKDYKDTYTLGGTTWRTFVIKWYDKPTKLACKLAPNTVDIINKTDVLSAMFSIMEPYSILPLHKGPYKGAMRYHLGLRVPKNRMECFINVNGKKYHWNDGEDVIFDDTYRHYVVNNTNEARIILFCDFNRPVIKPIDKIIRYINTNLALLSTYVKQVNDVSEQSLPYNKDIIPNY